MPPLKTLSYVLLFLICCAVQTAQAVHQYPIHFDNWTIIYNCDKRGYETFHYTTVPDQGSHPRYRPFHHEDALPESCRQFSTGTYKHDNGGQEYDLGHGVHQNIWDHDKQIMWQSNSMANIVPHARKLNRYGVWRKTEVLTECWRDHGELEVWGGVIWGDNSDNDLFLGSHGVTTPDYLWKVIKMHTGEVYAWLMPNTDEPKGNMVDQYLVAPKDIAALTGIEFDISQTEANERDEESVKKPAGCSIK